MYIKKRKYYVVWKGRKPGIYTSWDECKAQVYQFTGAKYKSFPTKEEAEKAYQQGSMGLNENTVEAQKRMDYIVESICVDAACSGNPGTMEYRGVYTKNGEEMFHVGPVKNGTNNIGEFLAIVHALALLKRQNNALPIYSDSETAINWVKNRKINTTLPRIEATKAVWELIDRAITWLNNNDYDNPILKWDSERWGEIKADFGRK